MEEKKKKNYFLKVLLIVFIIYFSLYLMDNLGYYNIARKSTILTNEKIKEFERDIEEGKNLDIKNYTIDDANYKNIYSNIGYNTSMFIDNIFNKGLKKLGKVLKILFK